MPREDYTKTINAIKETLFTISRQQTDMECQMNDITNVIHHIAPCTPVVSTIPTLVSSQIKALSADIRVMRKRLDELELRNVHINNQDNLLKQEQKATQALEERIENLEIYAAGHPHIKYSAFEPNMAKVYITSILYDKIIDILNEYGFTSSRLGMTLIPKDRTQRN